MTLNVYAPAIRDAIRRGDLDDVRTMLRDAKRFRRQQGDLDKAIDRLETAIARLSKKPRRSRTA
jgi:hypothetical protein